MELPDYVVASWGFAPALAAGNAVLVKPAEWTPLTTIRLGELAVEAGLPADLLQVLPGKGSVVGERFVTHPDVRKIVFTGSTEVGTKVMAVRPPRSNGSRWSWAADSANIVFADCDLERARDRTRRGIRQRRARLLCAQSDSAQCNIYDRFMELLEPAVEGVVVGDPAHGRRDQGCGVGDTPEQGGLRRAGSRRVRSPFAGRAGPARGFGFRANGLDPARTDRSVTEEIFGPVVTVLPFDDEGDAIALANDTAYGLSGSIWTDNLSRALRVSRSVQSGNLSVNSHSSVRFNTPFGDFKQSGLGRELGPDAPLSFHGDQERFHWIGGRRVRSI